MIDRMKTVGKRKPSSGLATVDALLQLVLRLRGNQPFIRKGIYRFKSFKEAQASALQEMTRKQKVR